MTRYSPRTGLPTTYQAGPFDSSHIYLQWGGKLPGGEQWSCGLRLYKPDPSSAEVDAALNINAYKTAIQTYHAGGTACSSQAAKLSYVKSNSIGTNGKYSTPTTNQVIVADVGGGGAILAPHPTQVALAISLVTGFSRGPAHRGRFYIPLPTFLPDANGLISVADRDGAKTAATTLLTALNAVTGGWKVGVFSRKAGAPGHRAVTGIEVGRVLDTQRRRRRSLTELYA